MRTIRYRAYYKPENRMIYDIQNEFEERIELGMNCFADYLNNDDFIVEQDTGLKDKNGESIWEGDIISFENEKGLARVLWLDGKAMFGIKWLDCGVKDELDYWNVCRGPAEVVGNIHEDCELFGRDNK